MSKPRILDPASGSRMFYFDKKNPDVVFGDIRHESHILCDGRVLEIAPDVVMDYRNMPFNDEQFKLVVFDPPHLKACGPKGWQGKKYGILGDHWQIGLKAGVDECFRVLEDGGVLIFKWNEHSLKVSEILKAIGRKPIFGHRTTANGKTVWMAFMKSASETLECGK